VIVEDRLRFDDDDASPAPRPVVVPVKPRAASPSWWQIATWVAMLAFMAGFGWQYYKNRPTPGPTPTPVVDAVTLGKTFAPKLAAALADGFEASDRFLSQGKSFKEANDILKQTFYDSRQKAFNDHAGAAITAIVPEGAEIKDDAQREAIRKLERDFAKGLRGGK
jgi:hypothetical protein